MRIDEKRVAALAREFVNSHRAELWSFVSDEVRHALIDAAVMDCVRLADVVENQAPLTPAQLVSFRDALTRALRDGVRSGKGKRWCRLEHPDVRPGLADVDQEPTS